MNKTVVYKIVRKSHISNLLEIAYFTSQKQNKIIRQKPYKPKYIISFKIVDFKISAYSKNFSIKAPHSTTLWKSENTVLIPAVCV